MSDKVAVDTGVVIEYIDQKGKYHHQAETVFSSLLAGNLKILLPHPVLAEVHYVSVRLYEALELENPRERAAKLVKWLRGLPTVEVSDSSADLAVEAGKAKLNFGLALTDCYVLAASRMCECKALFRKREKEMRKNADALEREYQIIFLKDYG
ncbi:hypothetical protein AKJ44_02570 [candidate division MSBL1 archaeon SCGC-AAA261F17]|uniref:PIN domain-containing protein n=1 Tax=candidate division MSBL1 archaeon SCGC-AAA261F17 TaxID=1698274 RepID=A0A133V4M3_9EURY|nr:hypothetical protein AKJ44_02570 [candidate division MSBL1 archaeon SCGC-AAA261F17]